MEILKNNNEIRELENIDKYLIETKWIFVKLKNTLAYWQRQQYEW